MLAWLILRGRLGRAFRAVRDSEVAAASSGSTSPRYKTLAFAIGGVYAGVAGSLLAIQAELRQPATRSRSCSRSDPRRRRRRRARLALGHACSAPSSSQYLPDLSTPVSKASRACPTSSTARPIILVDDPAPVRRRRAARAGLAETPNNPAIPPSLDGARDEPTLYLILCALGALALASPSRRGPLRARESPRRQVLIGGTAPLTRPGLARTSSVAEGRRTPTSSTSTRKGGVNKRKIKYDLQGRRATTRPRRAEQTRELVQQDKVFAIFNSLGTEQNLATRAVPERAQGAAALRRERRDDLRHGLQAVPVDDRLPAELPRRGDDLRPLRREDEAEGAQSASLYQNDDYGKDLLAGLKNGLGTKAKLIVSQAELRRRPTRTSSRRSLA